MTDSPQYISEQQARELVGRSEALMATEQAFAAMYVKEAENFPVVRQKLGHKDAIFGFKSGFDRSTNTLGVKAGGYWPQNKQNALMNHQSSVALFNPDTGCLQAIVAGNYLTALRTAAASAVSIKLLARTDSKVLSVIGAGAQAEYQVRAALDVRDFEKVVIANRTPEKAKALANRLADAVDDIETAGFQEAVSQADVLITVVSSWSAVVDAAWVKPGTHVACMGTDTKGKQEVDPALIAASRIYTDEIEQSIAIGECQHAYVLGQVNSDDITPIGAAIVDPQLRRTTEDEITLFDSTGVGMQDLAVARLALQQMQQNTGRTAI